MLVIHIGSITTVVLASFNDCFIILIIWSWWTSCITIWNIGQWKRFHQHSIITLHQAFSWNWRAYCFFSFGAIFLVFSLKTTKDFTHDTPSAKVQDGKCTAVCLIHFQLSYTKRFFPLMLRLCCWNKIRVLFGV